MRDSWLRGFRALRRHRRAAWRVVLASASIWPAPIGAARRPRGATPRRHAGRLPAAPRLMTQAALGLVSAITSPRPVRRTAVPIGATGFTGADRGRCSVPARALRLRHVPRPPASVVVRRRAARRLETAPISETTFAWWNLVAIVVTIIVVAVGLALVAGGAGDKIVELKRRPVRRRRRLRRRGRHPGGPGDASRIPTLLVGLALVAYLVVHYSDGGSATLDIVNWTFLALIFLLVRNPFELIALVKNAASNVARSCSSSRCTPGSWGSWPAPG